MSLRFGIFDHISEAYIFGFEARNTRHAKRVVKLILAMRDNPMARDPSRFVLSQILHASADFSHTAAAHVVDVVDLVKGKPDQVGYDVATILPYRSALAPQGDSPGGLRVFSNYKPTLH